MELTNFWAWILIIIGLFFVVAMPSMRQYQPEKFQYTIVLIGLVLLGVGIYLLVKP